MFHIPPVPLIPDFQRGTSAVRLRYDDISQDGRVQFEALPAVMGEAAWRNLVDKSPLATPIREQGILPILSRMVFEGRPGPFSVESTFSVQAAYAVAHEANAQSQVQRLFLNMWASALAPSGLTFGPLPEGPEQLAGRLFAQHVFTRPFGPPEERRVVELPGYVPHQDTQHMPPAPLSLLELPPGATPLDDALIPDAAPVVFGLCHTDSNQHVNSMVYPRLLEDAALRRFAHHGKSTVCLMRKLDMMFRRPCFAGETVQLVSRAFMMPDGARGVVALLLTPQDALLLPDVTAVKPRAVFRAVMED